MKRGALGSDRDVVAQTAAGFGSKKPFTPAIAVSALLAAAPNHASCRTPATLDRGDARPENVQPFQAPFCIVHGSVTEIASNCDVPIVHKAGESNPELHGTSHWWKNTGGMKAELLSADFFPVDADKHGILTPRARGHDDVARPARPGSRRGRERRRRLLHAGRPVRRAGILPALAVRYATGPAAISFAVNASAVGMAVAGLGVALFGRRIGHRRGITLALGLLAAPTLALAWAPNLAGALLIHPTIDRVPPMRGPGMAISPLAAVRANLSSPPLAAAFGVGFAILFAFLGVFT